MCINLVKLSVALTCLFALQVKALAVSTAATAAVGAAAYVALQCSGMQSKDMADVSSWKGAVIVLQQHRVRYKASPLIFNILPFVNIITLDPGALSLRGPGGEAPDIVWCFNRMISEKSSRRGYSKAMNRIYMKLHVSKKSACTDNHMLYKGQVVYDNV